MFFKCKECQKKQLFIESLLKEVESFKNLADNIAKKYDCAVTVDLKEATGVIQRLQEQNNKLVLEVAMYRSERQRGEKHNSSQR